jgi:hypothetical protein
MSTLATPPIATPPTATASAAGADTAHWEPKLPFDLVVVYEDTQTRERALRLYDHLAQQLLDDYDFQCTWWKISHLDDAVLHERALDAALDASMIVLSVRARATLPAPAQRWLDAWLGRKDDRKRALAALIGNPGQASADALALQTRLQSLARMARMDFFAHAFPVPEPAGGAAAVPAGAGLASNLGRRATETTPVLDEILSLSRPMHHWGINE